MLRTSLIVLGVMTAIASAPPSASAHGPIAPVASSYLARITSTPPGVRAQVVDGDLRMWMQVPASETVVVLDYRGAPYLRFSQLGVQVNENSAMYYLNQTPVAETPPPSLGPKTPPHWQLVSSGHDYNWHDGRLHALASVALAPGTRYVGKWRLPIEVDGRLSSISGGLWYAPNPSIVWFWPIAVLLLCVVAAWRVSRPALDRLTARVLGLAALAASVTAECGRALHGRPTVSVLELLELGLVLAFVAWALARILSRRAGYFSYFLVALVALFEGAELIPTLAHGFVLIALPAFVARTAAVVALGSGVGLLLLGFRLFDQSEEAQAGEHGGTRRKGEDDSALELV